jgi:hypothetical protein
LGDTFEMGGDKEGLNSAGGGGDCCTSPERGGGTNLPAGGGDAAGGGGDGTDEEDDSFLAGVGGGLGEGGGEFGGGDILSGGDEFDLVEFETNGGLGGGEWLDLGGGGGGGEGGGGGGGDSEVGGGEDGSGVCGESTLVELGGGVAVSSTSAADSSPSVAEGEGPKLRVEFVSTCKGKDSFDEEPGGGFPTEFDIILMIIYSFIFSPLFLTDVGFLSNRMGFHKIFMRFYNGN